MMNISCPVAFSSLQDVHVEERALRGELVEEADDDAATPGQNVGEGEAHHQLGAERLRGISSASGTEPLRPREPLLLILPQVLRRRRGGGPGPPGAHGLQPRGQDQGQDSIENIWLDN